MGSINVHGTVYQSDGTTPVGVNRSISIAVNGGTAVAAGMTSSVGVYGTLSPITCNAGDVLTIYIQDGINPEKAVTVTTAKSVDMTGIDLWQDTLILRSDNGGSLSQANVNTACANADTGITAIISAHSSTSFTVAAGKNFLIPGSQSFTSGSGSANNFGGNFTVDATDLAHPGVFVANGGTVNLTGTGTQKYSGANSNFYSLRVNGTGSTYTAVADGGSWSYDNALFVQDGTLDHSARFLIVTGLTTVQGGTLTGLGSPHFNGGLKITSGAINAASGDVTVVGDVNLAGGTLTAPAGNLTVSGDWLKNVSATFNHNNGTVILNGTAHGFQGNTTFYNLKKVVAAADTLLFTDLSTQTIVNSVDFEGASGQLLTLAGTGTSGWTVSMPATQTLKYLSVSHSTATTNTAVAINSTDGGSNTNWSFISPPTNSVAPSVDHLTGLTTATFTFSSGTWSGSPTSWKWEKSPDQLTWTQFSTAQNPSVSGASLGAGTRYIRLTATNAAGPSSPAELTGDPMHITSPSKKTTRRFGRFLGRHGH